MVARRRRRQRNWVPSVTTSPACLYLSPREKRAVKRSLWVRITLTGDTNVACWSVEYDLVMAVKGKR